MIKEKLIPKEVDIDSAIDTSIVKDARQFLASNKISASQVRYVNNAK